MSGMQISQLILRPSVGVSLIRTFPKCYANWTEVSFHLNERSWLKKTQFSMYIIFFVHSRIKCSWRQTISDTMTSQQKENVELLELYVCSGYSNPISLQQRIVWRNKVTFSLPFWMSHTQNAKISHLADFVKPLHTILNQLYLPEWSGTKYCNNTV